MGYILEDTHGLHSGIREMQMLQNCLEYSGSSPVACLCGSVGAKPGWILAISEAEEVPFFLAHIFFLCTNHRELESNPDHFRPTKSATTFQGVCDLCEDTYIECPSYNSNKIKYCGSM